MDGEGQDERESNVVRLPRDWIGPPEELVPFGPRARARDRERRERERLAHAADGPVETSGDHPPHGAHPTPDPFGATPVATDFWSGQADGDVHHAVHVPTVGDDPVRDPAARGRRALPRVRRPSRRASVLSAGAVTAAAVLTIAAIGLLEGHPSAVRARHSTPAQTTPRASSPRPVADSVSRPVAALPERESSVRVRSRARATHPPAHRRVVATHHPSRHPLRRAGHTAPADAVPASVATPAPTTASVAPIETETVAAGDATSEGGGTRRPSSSSSGPAGPLEPGTADNCNPKCS